MKSMGKKWENNNHRVLLPTELCQSWDTERNYIVTFQESSFCALAVQ